MDKYFQDANGNYFVATDWHEGYVPPEGATEIGEAAFWNAHQPVPPPTHNLSPLQRWRFKAMLRLSGYEAEVQTWLASLIDPESEAFDPQTWALASAILDESDEYRFDHPLTEQLRQVAGVTVEQLQVLWNYAHQL